MPEARHTDLDLTNPRDRDIYRQRVAQEYEHLQFDVIVREARRLRGPMVPDQPRIATRTAAARMIAAHRMQKLLGVWYA